MANLADNIERFILRKLSGEQGEIVILQRNELADELSCAPSQISYVLSTRFTIDRGYVVESRRGLGGFIRIMRVPIQRIVAEKFADNDYTEQLEDWNVTIERLQQQGYITFRESLLIKKFFGLTHAYVKPEKRVEILRAILLSLANPS